MSQGSALLALCLGPTVGWAMRTTDGFTTSGAQEFAPFRFQGEGAQFLRFGRWLDEMARSSGELGAVYVDELEPRADIDAAHLHGGFRATLLAWCDQRETPVFGMFAPSVRKRRGRKAGVGTAAKHDDQPQQLNEARALAMLQRVLSQQEATPAMADIGCRKSLLTGTLLCEARAHLEHGMKLVDLADVENEEAALALVERFPSMRELLFPGSPKCH